MFDGIKNTFHKINHHHRRYPPNNNNNHTTTLEELKKLADNNGEILTYKGIKIFNDLKECELNKSFELEIIKENKKYLPTAITTDNDGIVKEQLKIFDEIVGYDSVKKIIKSMLHNTPVSIVLDGPAGTGKSMFLHEINRFYPNSSVYVNGSKVTKAGLFKILFDDVDNKIKFLLVNEIDKMDSDTQETLLDLLEEGIVSETLKSNVRKKRYTDISVFATSNDISELIYPLQTRFFKVKVKAYTKAQFREIGEKVLEEYNLYPTIIDYIITKVVEQQPKPNIRSIKQIGKLCNNSAEFVDLLLDNSGD